MKTVYCIEQWWKENDCYSTDEAFWGREDELWKHGSFPILHEFDDEEEFKKCLLSIINNSGIIGKVYHKEMPDDYGVSTKLL